MLQISLRVSCKNSQSFARLVYSINKSSKKKKKGGANTHVNLYIRQGVECNRGRISIAINFLRNNVFPVGLGKSERPLGNFETDKFGAGVSYGNRIFSSAKMSCGGNISLLFTHLPRETIFLSLGTHGEEKRRIEHAERAAGKVLAPDVFSPREIPPLFLSLYPSPSRIAELIARIVRKNRVGRHAFV